MGRWVVVLALLSLGGCDGLTRWQAVQAAEARVRHELRDPKSAEFREITLTPDKADPTACGQVNSNNTFGGKTGFIRFWTNSRGVNFDDGGLHGAEEFALFCPGLKRVGD
jgi:hypothetical protein